MIKTEQLQEQQAVFNNGFASKFTRWVSTNLPDIMMWSSIAIILCLSILQWMHSDELLKPIKNVKIKNFINTTLTISIDAILFSFCLASAGLRFSASKLDNKLGKVTDEDGKVRSNPAVTRLRNWALSFFLITLLGRLGFTSLMLYWVQQTGDTAYFNAISRAEQMKFFVFIQFLNVLATFGAEGSAFLLNSNASMSQDTQADEQDTSTGGSSKSRGNATKSQYTSPVAKEAEDFKRNP